MGFVEEYGDYLADESRSVGWAEDIALPKSHRAACQQLADWAGQGRLVTVQSGLTGIAGGAVPQGGSILNLSRMNRVLGMRRDSDGVFYVLVEAGCTLRELQTALRSCSLDVSDWSAESREAWDAYLLTGGGMFPPDLTETSACLGGVAANNGSGARTFRYGAARRHINGMRLALIDGDELSLYRSGADGYAPQAEGRTFEIKTQNGRRLCGRLPGYTMPAVKNAAGYYAADDMSLVDLFVGSEGTLGVITEVELRLTPVPPVMWGLTAFFADEEGALDYVEQVREAEGDVAAIEFFSAEALALIRQQRKAGGAFEGVPELKAGWHTAVYVELHSADESVAAESLMALSDIMQRVGGDPDATWFAGSEAEIERFKGIRHAVPESVNMLIASRKKQIPELTKLGTDLAVPDDCLRRVMAMYHRDLRRVGLDYVIFGHIGNNHVHVNILPRSLEEYAQGKALYAEWAQQVAAMDGTVSAEHGIGKLKREMLEIMYGTAGIDEMRAVKKVFDSDGRLNRGTLFEWR